MGCQSIAGLPPALNSPVPIYTPGTVRVKCLAQEHNTMSPARARTRALATRSGDERTNHEATAPLSRLTCFITFCLATIQVSIIHVAVTKVSLAQSVSELDPELHCN